MVSRAERRIGEVIERQFRIEALLGVGGMGEAYSAEQLGMDRRAVIKLMHAHVGDAEEMFRARFAREARVVAQLNHPNIVQIYACGQTDDGVPYLAMEFVDGRTLKEELSRHGTLEEARVLHIGRQVCSALSEAHAQGIIHRDLKPENIMITARHGDASFVKLLDFGIAKMAGAGEPARLTRSGMVFGTPQYMSPEQIRGATVDARSDLYALGLVLYELLAATPAVVGDSEFDVLTRQVTEAPPALSEIGVGVSAGLEHAIHRCLEKDPARRWTSAGELDAALWAALSELIAPARGQAAQPLRQPATTVSLPLPRADPKPVSRPPKRSAAERDRQDAADRDEEEEGSETGRSQSYEEALRNYNEYYARIPLPGPLKPFFPWIMALVFMSFTFAMSQCATLPHASSSTSNVIRRVLRELYRAFVH